MLAFNTVFRNGTMYETTTNTNMNENSSSENNPGMSIHEESRSTHLNSRGRQGTDAELHFTSEETIEDLIWLIQGMSSTQQLNNYPKAGASARFSAALYQPDTH